MHNAMSFGFGGFLLLVLWLIGAAILFGVVYAAVRLGVFHALKAHTLWQQGGQAGAVRPAPPAPHVPPGPPASPAPPESPGPQLPPTPPAA